MDRPARSSQIEALFADVPVRAFAGRVGAEHVAALLEAERNEIASMSPNRQAEFATARVCAHLALAEHGLFGPVLRGEAGEPLWPAGVSGSISHTRGFCAAVTTIGNRSIGLDVEEVERMTGAIERRVLVDAERDELDVLDPNDEDTRRRRVATIFAAKESFYKAHHALVPRYLGFDAVTVSIRGRTVQFGPASGAVDAELLDRTAGRWLVHDGRVMVGVSIDATDWGLPLPSSG